MTNNHQHDHNDHHHHHHGHHGHSHHMHGETLGRIKLAFWLNFIFAILELFGGIWTNSMAILSDAIHDFGDALAIGTALYLEKKSVTGSDQQFSYGYRRLSTASAVITGFVLILGAIWVFVECIPRLLHPETPKVDGMIGFAIVGVLVNGFGALRMSVGRSLNERVITWHLLEDLFGWILVLVGALVMKFYDVPILDSILGMILSAWVLWNVVRNLKEGMKIFLQATPVGLDIPFIESFLKHMNSVQDCHHTHIWTLDGESHILTTHVVVKPGVTWAEHLGLKADIKKALREKFNIQEATIEVEAAGEACFDPSHS